jgi:hypothetical protein
LRFYRFYDTPLYNFIIETIENDGSFLQSEYFSFDYSRNSYYCPKQTLQALHNLQELQKTFLSGYKKVSLYTNLEPLALPHFAMASLHQNGLFAAKTDAGTIVLFSQNDALFQSGVFSEEEGGYLYFTFSGDRYALSKSLGIQDKEKFDRVFGTNFAHGYTGAGTKPKSTKPSFFERVKRLFFMRYLRIQGA